MNAEERQKRRKEIGAKLGGPITPEENYVLRFEGHSPDSLQSYYNAIFNDGTMSRDLGALPLPIYDELSARVEFVVTRLRNDLASLQAQLEETQRGFDAAMIARVHAFADQLLAWGHEDAAAQVRREILQGPVTTDQDYQSLVACRAALKERDALLARIETLARSEQCRGVVEMLVRRGEG